MKHREVSAIVRMNELQQQIDLLAGIGPSPHPVISAYLDLRQDTGQLTRFTRRRIEACARHFPADERARLRACGESVVDRLLGEHAPRALGLAIFATVDGEAPLLTAMPFAVPFINGLTVSSSPDIFPLLQLREMYGRFTIVTAKPEGLQVVEVNLGEVAIRAWAATPQSQPMLASDSTVDAAADVDIRPQVQLIERVLSKARSGPLFLAGDVETMQRIRDQLSPLSVDRLVGAMPVPADKPLKSIAALCLRSLVDFEVNQAFELTERILREVQHHGPAVAGPEASLRALRSGSAERLLLGNEYRPKPGWICTPRSDNNMGRLNLQQASVEEHGGTLDAANLRVELIRLAGLRRIPVEFTEDDALNDFGGVACLLRDHAEQMAQRRPPRYGSLDLVA